MRSDQLTGDQLDAIAAKVRPMLIYTRQLAARMSKRGFARDDELLKLTTEAANCVQALTVEVQGLMCDGPAASFVRQPKIIMPSNADDPLGRKPRK